MENNPTQPDPKLPIPEPHNPDYSNPKSAFPPPRFGRKKLGIVLLLIILVLIPISFLGASKLNQKPAVVTTSSPSPTPYDPTFDWFEYENSTWGYSIKHPYDFKIVEPQLDRGEVYISSHDTFGPNGENKLLDDPLYRDGIAIIIKAVKVGPRFYFDACAEPPDQSLEKVEEVGIPNMLRYTTHPLPNSRFPTYDIVYIYGQNNAPNCYTITFSARSSYSRDSYLELSSAMAKSFKLTNSTDEAAN